MVNRAKGGDRFQPMMFETRTRQMGSTTDLFQEAFGNKPSVVASVGSRKRSEYMYKAMSLTRLDTTKPGGAEKLMPLEDAVLLDQEAGLR